MAFAQRHLDFRFQLGQGAFGADGSDTVDLTGLRATANITRAGGNTVSSAELRIYGMPPDVMAKLTVLNLLSYQQMRQNIVTVLAGDEQSGSTVAFVGTIKEAWVDAQAAPDVAFHVLAYSALFESLKPVSPISYNGSVDVATVISGIAQQMDMTLENNGVSVQLQDAYYPGTLRMQLQQVARHAGINFYIDDIDRVIAIWPAGGSRGGVDLLVSKDTGLVGYPTFTEQGCRFKMLYNPSIAFGQGLTVKSDIAAASGHWVIAYVSHNLDAYVPDGIWFTEVDCTLAGHPLPIISGS